MALAIDAMTVEVTSAFAEAGVQSILLKGPTFARLLYPEGGRTYTDSDLLVRRSDIARAEAVLDSLGYFATQEGFAPSERDADSSTFLRVRQGKNPEKVDLHWNLHLAADPDQTWTAFEGEREHMVLGGRSIAMLNVPARALHVAIHAAQHGLMGPQRFEQGGQTGEDLRRALATIARSDWERASVLATEIGAEHAFAYGLRLDPGGAALAAELRLAIHPPDVWQFRMPFENSRAARGAASFHRLVAAPSLRAKAVVVGRAVFPSRARARRVADSSFGRSSVAGAYLEYWRDAVVGLVPAIRSGIKLRRATRHVRD